ncbi:MAG: trehalose-phosphatase [Proteobacteria bacterium]|nr:trehalose-phosphatase [Pseudomonadota bacterium]
MHRPRAGRAAPSAALPVPSRRWALFLDVDGTLLDLAAAPDAVEVPRGLRGLLRRLHRVLSGGLALVSGRTIADLDRLFAPLRLPAAGQHGAELRSHEAAESVRSTSWHDFSAIAANLQDRASAWPGVLVENKGACVAVHYRNAAHKRDALLRLMTGIADSDRGIELMGGKMVLELKPRRVDKGRAIEWFMARPPFCGREPVFIGDDRTDAAGIAAVLRMAGRPIEVGRATDDPTVGRIASPAALRHWLRGALTTLAEK